MIAVSAKMAALSVSVHLENGRNGVIAQSTTAGATIKVPAASVSHHVIQWSSWQGTHCQKQSPTAASEAM